MEAKIQEYYNFTISDIEALTDVRIERNKRNGRSQKEAFDDLQMVKHENALTEEDIRSPPQAFFLSLNQCLPFNLFSHFDYIGSNVCKIPKGKNKLNQNQQLHHTAL